MSTAFLEGYIAKAAKTDLDWIDDASIYGGAGIGALGGALATNALVNAGPDVPDHVKLVTTLGGSAIGGLTGQMLGLALQRKLRDKKVLLPHDAPYIMVAGA